MVQLLCLNCFLGGAGGGGGGVKTYGLFPEAG